VPDLDPRAIALKCRSLAHGMVDDETVRTLNRLAEEYEANAQISHRNAASGMDTPVDPPD
jgi:hypothetical protein